MNIVSGLSQGFAISGANSRTAVNDANGGKSQLVSVIAALAIAMVVAFFSEPLQFIPIPVLGVVLIYASWSLLDMRSIFRLRKRNRSAFYLALFTFLSVLLLGVNADGMIHSIGKSNGVKPVDGVIMYRFNSPLTYFNVAYFKRRIATLVDASPGQPRWVVIDAVASFTHADISVLAAVEELKPWLSKIRAA